MNFGPEYARLYEAKYARKDYTVECDMVENAMAGQRIGPGASVLDVGCGVGGHSFELAKRGYRVTGVDRSPSMIGLARAKLHDGVMPDFEIADVTRLRLGRQFDVAIMMFAVLSYMESNSDLLACLSSVREHLRPGGILMADFWYGPGVLTDPPQERVAHISVADGMTTTKVRPKLHLDRDVCTLAYEITRGDPHEVSTEEHRVRYFFIPELELALGSVGLDLLQTLDGKDWGKPLDGATWSAAIVARRRSN
jgi:SAM-dependent methyltransferase